MLDQRPPIYLEGATTVIRASALGLPLRSLVAGRLGYPMQGPPDYVREAGCEGSRLEPEIKKMLGIPVADEQHQVEFCHYHESGDSTLVRGHIDGAVGPRTLLEVKTCGEDAYTEWRMKRWAVRPTWAWQVSAYCLAGGYERVTMAVYCRDTEDLDVFNEEPPYGDAELATRLDQVEAWYRTGELPPPERATGWDPWAHIGRPAAEEDHELEALLREYDELGGADKQSAARKADLRKRILFHLGDRPRVVAGALEACYSQVVSERIDVDALKRDHPELVAQYLRRSEAERLVIRRVQ